MKQNLTELVFILDRSGSMHGLESDTIGGFNTLLEKQQAMEGQALVTTVLFNNHSSLLHDRIAIQGVQKLTKGDYTVSGNTALLDAIGQTLEKIQAAQHHTAEAERPAKTIVVITTDGMENASHTFSRSQIQSMVRELEQGGAWEFLFLGANMDAIAVAGDIGIRASNAVRCMNDSQGTRTSYASVESAMQQIRSFQPLTDHWKKEIEADFLKRSH